MLMNLNCFLSFVLTKVMFFSYFFIIMQLFIKYFKCPFQILYEINYNFMEELKKRIGLDYNRLSRMSIVEEGAVKVL